MGLTHGLAVLLAFALLVAACGGAGEPEATPTSVASATPTSAPTFTPVATETPAPAPSIPDASPAAEIQLPAGFSAFAVAEGLSFPTSIGLGADGSVYVSERFGNVFRLIDANGDGAFEERSLFTSGFEEVTGLAVAPDGLLYVSSRGRVTTVSDVNGDLVGDTAEDIIAGLPVGRHQNDGLAFGPDGKLYFANGSTCDDAHDCPEGGEPDERSATILQANPDGSALRVYASGLRNAYDLVFDGQGRLWATDNGSDEPCETIDELNLIEDGGDYGWPYGAVCDPYQSGTPPVADLGLHTASTGIDYYDSDQFPPEYRGDLFATLWGSFVFEPELRPQLLRIVINEAPAGPEASIQEFATGFVNPIDVVVDHDGTLLVLDYSAGTLYRIIHTGG